jgi:hypothetical protein
MSKDLDESVDKLEAATDPNTVISQIDDCRYDRIYRSRWSLRCL